MADSDSLDLDAIKQRLRYWRCGVGPAPDRPFMLGEMAADFERTLTHARDLRSQLAELRTPRGAMENAQRVIRDARIGVALDDHQHTWCPEPPLWDYSTTQSGSRTCTGCGRTIYD